MDDTALPHDPMFFPAEPETVVQNEVTKDIENDDPEPPLEVEDVSAGNAASEIKSSEADEMTDGASYLIDKLKAVIEGRPYLTMAVAVAAGFGLYALTNPRSHRMFR